MGFKDSEEQQHQEGHHGQQDGAHPVDVPHVVGGVQAQRGGLDRGERDVGPMKEENIC